MTCTERPRATLAVLACLAACAGDMQEDAGEPDVSVGAVDVSSADTDTSATDEGALDADGADARDGAALLPPIVGTAAILDLAADVSDPAAFWSTPFPTDTRQTQHGAPDWYGLPHPRGVDLIEGIIEQAAERPGFPAMPVIYFRFDGAVATQDPWRVHPAESSAPVWLVRVDADSPPAFVPTVARTLPADGYTPEHLLAVAPRPGFVLEPGARYAAVVLRSLLDADGNELGVASSVRNLLAGRPLGSVTHTGWETHGIEVAQLAARLGVDRDRIAAFTVFTTGDPTRDLLDLTDAIVASHRAEITDVRLAPDGASHERFCHLLAEVELPQFQVGTPPFADGGGTFTYEPGSRVPAQQRVERVPISLTIPRTPPPESGYPFVLYLHGSGGVSTQVVDRGPVLEPGGPRTSGLGPAHVLAGLGIAALGTALPINPERVPGAADITYIVANPLAFRDNIRQGTLEQRLLYGAMAELAVPADVAMQCGDTAIGAAPIRFDTSSLLLMGQSQGGHYANVVAAVEHGVDVVVPTGAGGFMSWLVLEQPRNNLRPILAAILGSTPDLHYTHPAMALLQTAWEPVEPLLYMARLHHRPLPGRGPLSVYAPVAEGDSFYPTHIYDAVAIAYRSPLAGAPTWPALGEALALAGVDAASSYPLRGNVYDGAATAAIVQYQGDGLEDPHSIFSQLDAVKHQYGCFFRTHLDHGIATLAAPGAEGADCP